MSDTKYLAGLYLRLSKDDERAGESVSIENQRLLLTQYVQEKGWEIKETYIDDGWSGTSMQRPAFQRMIRDAEDRRINLIIVKDLSRLGRNYIEVGRLTEETLPRLGCRFVALNDSVDSMLGDNDMMVYRNLFNEFYSKDTSKKVRAVKQSCIKQGKYLGTFAPLGYMKNPANKHQLIVDEETAQLVRKIYQMRVSGMGHLAIAYALNNDNIPSARALCYSRLGKENPSKQNMIWSQATVRSILGNEVYIGNMVQGKATTVSYKNRTQIRKPEEQWVRVENTHEPIISMDVWETVRTMEGSKFKPRPDIDGEHSIFAGLIYCADCGHKMRRNRVQWKRANGTEIHQVKFICGRYASGGKSTCTAHHIYEEPLSELISAEIREHARLAVYDEKRVLNAVMDAKNHENKTYLASYQRELKSAEDRLRQLDNTLSTLYEDKVNGVVTEAIFKSLAAKYESERSEKSNTIAILSGKVEKCQKDFGDADAWLQTVSKYAEMETLTAAVLLELIDRIEIFEAEGSGRSKELDIRVCYRFIGHIGDAVLNMKAVGSDADGDLAVIDGKEADSYAKAV